MKPGSWLLLLYALPTRRNAERVNLWRKLKKFGAVQLKTAGYVLPDAPNHLERFQWLSKQIVDAGGDANLIRVREIDGVSSQEVMGMFNSARAADYKELSAACQDALARNKKRKAAAPPQDLPKLKQRFAEIREIDYFASPAAHDAQMLLQQLEKSLASKKGAAALLKLDPRQFVGKTWLTRPRPGIDRAGSAWLIRKFIDPKARFIFGMEPAKHPSALPFDMAEVEFSHHADDCTFETLVKRFAIADKAVLRMAEMVHDADLEDGKFQRHECTGINTVLTGWERTGLSDSELLAKGIDCFEGLYQALKK
jgi:hypothetical protein